LILASCCSALAQPPAKPKPYRLPAVDIKQRIIWDAKCEEPKGSGLAFGGQDQQGDDGRAGTRILLDGKWQDLNVEIPKKQAELEQLIGVGREKVTLARRALLSDKGNSNDIKPNADALQKLERELDLQYVSPPLRALSAIAYDPKTELYVMFGGDHLDYLMNDTWIFNMKTKRWSQQMPASAPSARANHKLIANGDGTITLKGGYTYSNNTDYMGGPYIDIGDGDWTYDVLKNEWKGEGKSAPPCTRVYRSGPFHPSYFVQDPKPDAKAFAKWLDDLPMNDWKKTNPPHLPQMNRDWGTAVFDPDHDLILRWSGGHCAHSGSDVLHFHLATNRWELPFPVELPLGQTYTNTEYPDGFNFNKRPWITGHTYQTYAYDTKSSQLIFTGRPRHIYFYDPAKGDWTGTRNLKPKGMSYDSCFYTLTLAPTPHGLVCWTAEGKLFYNEQLTLGWTELKISDEKLPGAVVDNSTLAYDSKRDRLLFFRKGYGEKNTYDGEIHELDWKTLKVRKLSPEGMKEAVSIPYLCQIRYDPVNDLMLVGATLPPDADMFRRTPAYDCANNRWVAMKITGDDPSGKTGRNVSLGLMYDAKRKLWWAVDTRSQVYVMRLEPKTADVQALH
jgi:hypothetical protein